MSVIEDDPIIQEVDEGLHYEPIPLRGSEAELERFHGYWKAFQRRAETIGIQIKSLFHKNPLLLEAEQEEFAQANSELIRKSHFVERQLFPSRRNKDHPIHIGKQKLILETVLQTGGTAEFKTKPNRPDNNIKVTVENDKVRIFPTDSYETEFSSQITTSEGEEGVITITMDLRDWRGEPYPGFPSEYDLTRGAVEFFKHHHDVRGLRVMWDDQSDEYKHFFTDKAEGMSDEEAAFRTHFGEIARRLGFSGTIRIDEGTSNPPLLLIDFLQQTSTVNSNADAVALDEYRQNRNAKLELDGLGELEIRPISSSGKLKKADLLGLYFTTKDPRRKVMLGIAPAPVKISGNQQYDFRLSGGRTPDQSVVQEETRIEQIRSILQGNPETRDQEKPYPIVISDTQMTSRPEFYQAGVTGERLDQFISTLLQTDLPDREKQLIFLLTMYNVYQSVSRIHTAAIHRDLNYLNILVDSQNLRPKIIDFGDSVLLSQIKGEFADEDEQKRMAQKQRDLEGLSNSLDVLYHQKNIAGKIPVLETVLHGTRVNEITPELIRDALEQLLGVDSLDPQDLTKVQKELGEKYFHEDIRFKVAEITEGMVQLESNEVNSIISGITALYEQAPTLLVPQTSIEMNPEEIPESFAA